MKNLRTLTLVLLLGLLAGMPNASAVPTLRFSGDSFATVSCPDQAACDLNPALGVVTFSDDLGNFEINVTTGITKPAFPDPPAHMDLNSLNVNALGPGGGTLDMEFSEIGFSLPGFGFIVLFGGTMSFGAGSTVTASAYFDEGNALFAQTTLIDTLGPFGPGAFAATGSGPGPAVAPFSLTQVLSLVTTGSGSFSGDFELLQIPEPASVVLLGGLLLLTTTAIRRKLRRV